MLRLKFERTHRQLSQHAVGLVVHLPQPYIASIERGRMIPSPTQLQRLAAFFGVKPEDLLKDVVVLGMAR